MMPRLPANHSPLLLALAPALMLLLGACARSDDAGFPGYAEGDYVRLTAPIAGTLMRLYVQRGDQAVLGAPAFLLEQESESAARQAAQSRLERARAQLDDLRKGKRPDEVAALAAQLQQAEAALALSQADLLRDRKLLAQSFVSQARLDQSNAAVLRDRAGVDTARAQLRLAHIGSRPDQIAAAARDAEAAQGDLAQAQWRVDQKTQKMPVAGDVVDTGYRVGEWVPAGGTIVTVLPPANLKARFFVPQEKLASLRLGSPVTIACDGCTAIPGKISFIASAAEYTSPLIYSKENRATLVFMIEALPAPAAARQLHPGQPLSIRLQAVAPAPTR